MSNINLTFPFLITESSMMAIFYYFVYLLKNNSLRDTVPLNFSEHYFCLKKVVPKIIAVNFKFFFFTTKI